jgi:hypothetical protein
MLRIRKHAFPNHDVLLEMPLQLMTPQRRKVGEILQTKKPRWARLFAELSRHVRCRKII